MTKEITLNLPSASSPLRQPLNEAIRRYTKPRHNASPENNDTIYYDFENDRLAAFALQCVNYDLRRLSVCLIESEGKWILQLAQQAHRQVETMLPSRRD